MSLLAASKREVGDPNLNESYYESTIAMFCDCRPPQETSKVQRLVMKRVRTPKNSSYALVKASTTSSYFLSKNYASLCRYRCLGLCEHDCFSHVCG